MNDQVLPNRVLLTGANGFIGSRVARMLLEAGCDLALLLRPHAPRGRAAPLRARCTVVEGDMHDIERWRASVAAFRPDAVVHLAWDGVYGERRNDPAQLANVGASLQLYRFAQDLGCSHFVGMGSQAEYGPVSGRITEATPTHPATVYGAAKLAVGSVLSVCSAVGQVPVSWLRLFSCYGPGDAPVWLIPYVARTLLQGGRPSLTAAEQVWDYLHVDDAARAVLACLAGRTAGVFNLGSGQARPLREFVMAVRDAIDPELPLEFGEQPYRVDQVMHLEADVGALCRATGWRPQVPLAQGIRQTVEWYREEAAHAG